LRVAACEQGRLRAGPLGGGLLCDFRRLLGRLASHCVHHRFSFDEHADRNGQASLYAGGVAAISRWLSAATPPVHDRTNPTTPEGSQRPRPPPFDYSKYRGSYSIPALANMSGSSSRDERTR